MKVLQEQYNLIKEGKGNKAHFLKTAFRLFPDMLSPVNTYEDTVHILKNRSIISEGIRGVVTTGKTPDWHQIFKENITEAAKAEEKEATKEVTDMETAGYDYKDKKNYNNVFGEEFLKGFYTEMGDSKNEGKTVEELRQIVAKNLSKDMNYYVKDGQFGLKGIGYTTEAPGLGTPKEAKGKFKSSGYGDLKEGKIPAENRNTYYYGSLAKKMKKDGKNKEEIRQFFKDEKVDSKLVDSILTNLFLESKSLNNNDLKENKDPKAEISFYNSLKMGDKVIYNGPEKNGFMKGDKVEVSRIASSSTFEKTITVKKGDKKLVVKGHGSLKPLNESYSPSSLKESVLRAFISEMVKEVLNENMGSEDELSDIIAKYVKDADDIDKELDNYFDKGYQGFSDTLKANLSKDMDFQTWVQKEHDKETLKREIGEALKPEDKEMFSKATDVAEKLYDKLGNVKAVLAKIPAEYASFKDELEQHLIQKYEG